MADFNNTTNGNDLKKMQDLGDFTLEPYPGVNLIGNPCFREVKMDDAQQMQLNALAQQFPSLIERDDSGKAYKIKFTNGLPHTLMKLMSGGLGTPFVGGAGGIVTTAALCSTALEGMIFGTFSIMSVLTGQFFLFFIKKELDKINHHLERIQDFLYGDKKAELIAETIFTQYATDNYSSIMSRGEQRSATISSLQQSQKIAIKDIEFYTQDLDMTANAKNNKALTITDCKHFCNIVKCLELSRELYVKSSLMEVHYSQNYDSKYMKYIKDKISTYINTSRDHMLIALGKMDARLNAWNGPDIDDCHKSLEGVRGRLENEKKSLGDLLSDAINETTKPISYYIECSDPKNVKVLADAPQ